MERFCKYKLSRKDKLRISMSRIYANVFKSKSQLMGLAICLVMARHTLWPGLPEWAEFFKNLCDIGVDVFLFLSGFTCANSFCRQPDLKKYLRKRFVRVVPAYLVVAVLWFAYHDILKGGGTWATLGYDVFALNFFLGGHLDFWYIPAMLCFYLLLPFYVRVAQRSKWVSFVPALIVVVAVVVEVSGFFVPQCFLYLRLPIFLLGIHAFLSKGKGPEARPWLLLCLAAGALAAVWLFSSLGVCPNLRYLLYIPVVVAIVRFWPSLPLPGLAFLGIYSLELYLLHERVQWFLDYHVHNPWGLLLLSVSLSIALAFGLHVLLDKVGISRPVVAKPK